MAMSARRILYEREVALWSVSPALAKEMNAPHQNFIATALRPPPDAFSPFEVDCPDETRHFIMEGNGGLTWEGRIAAATKLWLTQHHFCHASDVVVWSPPVMM